MYRDELIIESGDITVKSVGLGIKGKDYLIINGGKFNITSGGDGLKSDKDSTENEGFIEINNGEFDIVSVHCFSVNVFLCAYSLIEVTF